jgi:hypothetical protein
LRPFPCREIRCKDPAVASVKSAQSPAARPPPLAAVAVQHELAAVRPGPPRRSPRVPSPRAACRGSDAFQRTPLASPVVAARWLGVSEVVPKVSGGGSGARWQACDVAAEANEEAKGGCNVAAEAKGGSKAKSKVADCSEGHLRGGEDLTLLKPKSGEVTPVEVRLQSPQTRMRSPLARRVKSGEVNTDEAPRWRWSAVQRAEAGLDPVGNSKAKAEAPKLNGKAIGKSEEGLETQKSRAASGVRGRSSEASPVPRRAVTNAGGDVPESNPWMVAASKYRGESTRRQSGDRAPVGAKPAAMRRRSPAPELSILSSADAPQRGRPLTPRSGEITPRGGAVTPKPPLTPRSNLVASRSSALEDARMRQKERLCAEDRAKRFGASIRERLDEISQGLKSC